MQFTIEQSEHGKRIEKILQSRFKDITRSQWKFFVETKKVKAGGHFASWGERVREGTEIILLEEPVSKDLWAPAPCATPALKLVSENERWMVMDKPPGLPTLPKNPDDTPTAAGFMAFTYPHIIEEAFPKREGGIVNRLDNNTSGLLLVAKRSEVYEKFRKQYMNHTVEKEYWALCRGDVKRQWIEGRVISESGPSDRVGWEEGDGGAGRRAVSLIEPLESAGGYTLVRVITRFGRRHQVRVQLASLGCPIYNDPVYGSTVEGFSGHFLWARRISFPKFQPKGQRGPRESIDVESISLPAGWLALVKDLGFTRSFEGINEF